MRIKDNFVLQQIVDEYIVVPVAEESERLHGIIKLNETGAFLWDLLRTTEVSVSDLEDALARKYNIGLDIAQKDVEAFINHIRQLGCVED